MDQSELDKQGERLESAIANLRDISLAMSAQLHQQNILLDNLSNGISKSNNKLTRSQNRINNLRKYCSIL